MLLIESPHEGSNPSLTAKKYCLDYNFCFFIEQILKLRLEGKTYSEINTITGASKATISYHCKRNGLDGRVDGKGIKNKDISDINEYYKTHTLKETSDYFKVGVSTLKTILEHKRKQLTDDEKITYNYSHVKSFRKKKIRKGL